MRNILRTIPRYYFFVLILFAQIPLNVCGQFKSDKLGHRSEKNKFIISGSDSGLTKQWYKPKADKTVYYDGQTGKKDYLYRQDAIYVREIQVGEYDGKSGKWAVFNQRSFVLLSDLDNWQEEYIADIHRVRLDAMEAVQKRWEDEFLFFLKVSGTVILVLTVTITLIVRNYRKKRKCPSCTAPLARQKIGVENLGRPKKYLTQEQQPVWIGQSKNGMNHYRNIPVMKKKTVRNYAILYQCKYCKHKWSDEYQEVKISDIDGDIEIK